MIAKTKSFRYNGCKFVYRRLTPDLFLNQQYPLSKYTEVMKSDKTTDEKVQDLREYIRPAIEKGVIDVRKWFRSIPYSIDEIMEEVELYNKLYVKIIQFTFKKKT